MGGWGEAQPSLQAERQVAAPEAKFLDCQDTLASLAGLANTPAFEVRTSGRLARTAGREGRRGGEQGERKIHVSGVAAAHSQRGGGVPAGRGAQARQDLHVKPCPPTTLNCALV